MIIWLQNAGSSSCSYRIEASISLSKTGDLRTMIESMLKNNNFGI